MIEQIINSFQLRLAEVRRLVSDLSDRQMTTQPAGVRMNPPAWQLGHIVCSMQAIGGEMGISPWLSESWTLRFRQGSRTMVDADGCPNRDELLSALADGERRIVERLRAMTADDLAGPLPDTRFRDAFPSLGHAVLHILAGHVAVHVGQLAAWRRVMDLSEQHGSQTHRYAAQSVFIRELAMEDHDAYVDWQTDPKVAEFVSWLPRSREEALRGLEQAIAQQSMVDRADFFMAVVRCDDQEVVGSVGITRIDEHVGDIGWFIRSKYWGMGYASEAAAQMVTYGFEVIGLDSIRASCRKTNTRSEKIMQRCGFRLTSTTDRRLHYTLNRSDWNPQRDPR